MTFTQSVRTCLVDKYGTTSGRASRSEYWWFQVLLLPVYVLVSVLTPDAALPGGTPPSMVPTVILLPAIAAIAIPGIAVSVRRMHDINISGWWSLVSVVPFIGFLIMLVLTCRPGSAGWNRFGADPLDPDGASNPATPKDEERRP